ncbi:MAG: lysophospholipid acyltransferase family protein [Acidimicrobiales bacterium]
MNEAKSTEPIHEVVATPKRNEIVGDAGYAFGSEMSRLQRTAYMTLWYPFVILAKLYFRFEVHGSHNLPPSGAFILSPVHRSYLDTPVLTLINRRVFRFMGKESLWSNSVGAWFLSMMGGFPVQRGTADRSAINAAQTILERGEPLVMFPEGTRREGPLILAENMNDGPSFVAGRMQVPIVPIGIGGSDKIMPKGKKFVYPRKLVFVIGEPLAPPEQIRGRVPRRLVREHATVLREKIQGCYDQAQTRASIRHR